MRTITFRLKPGEDLRAGIQKAAQEHGMRAGYIISCVAGLRQVRVRMAGATPEK